MLALAGCPSPAGDPLDETSETSGDGDGDPATGDGDGDPTTTTGDGDGDATTTGDGDGDETTTGDGDGDPDVPGSARLFFAEGINSSMPSELFMVEVDQDGPSDPVLVHTADPEGGILVATLSHDASYYTFVSWAPNDQDSFILATDNFPPEPAIQVDTPPIPDPTLVGAAEFSPDNSLLALRAGAAVDPVPTFYMSEVVEGQPQAPIVFNAPFAEGGAATGEVVFSADGTQLAYTMDVLGDDVSQVFVGEATLAAAGQATQISDVPDGFDARAYRFKPDGSAIYYNHATGLDTLGWFVVDLSGEEPGPPNAVHGPVDTKIRPHFSDDGNRFLYWTGPGILGDLYLVEVPGANPGPAVKLNLEMDVYPKFFEFVDDAGTRVHYVRDAPEGAYSVLLDVSDGSPGQELVLNGPDVEGGEVSEPRIVGDRLFYFSTPQGGGTELYLVDLASEPPSQPVKLNGELAPGGSLTFELIVADDTDLVLYTAEDGAGQRELHGVDLASPGESFVINHELGLDEDVNYGARLSSEGRFVFYSTGTGAQSPRPLYVVDLVGDGPGVSSLLSDPAKAVSRLALVP